jgi:hypothetical protein
MGSQNELPERPALRAQARSVTAQACSPSAQVKAAAAHVWRLNWNQKKNILSLSTEVGAIIFFLEALIRLVASLPLLRR